MSGCHMFGKEAGGKVHTERVKKGAGQEPQPVLLHAHGDGSILLRSKYLQRDTSTKIKIFRSLFLNFFHHRYVLSHISQHKYVKCAKKAWSTSLKPPVVTAYPMFFITNSLAFAVREWSVYMKIHHENKYFCFTGKGSVCCYVCLKVHMLLIYHIVYAILMGNYSRRSFIRAPSAKITIF